MSENMHCAECGQLVGPATVFHPYLYCLLYKKLHVTDQEAFLRSYGFERVAAPLPTSGDPGEGR